MNIIPPFDGVQPMMLWHHQTNSITVVPSALIRRFRHRLYSQVVAAGVPVNFAHWYFSASDSLPAGAVRPLPGDEITESDGTLWTILEVNRSPLTGIWQAVCETFAFAVPTENVEHLRQQGAIYITIMPSLPVRVGTKTTIFVPEFSERLTFYVRPATGGGAAGLEPNDIFRQSDGSQWKIIRVEHPLYRARWTAVGTEKMGN